jgi:hypothetical protein
MSLLMKHIGERKAGRERVGMDQTLSILSKERASEPEIQNEVHLRASGSGSGTAPKGLRPHTPVS